MLFSPQTPDPPPSSLLMSSHSAQWVSEPSTVSWVSYIYTTDVSTIVLKTNTDSGQLHYIIIIMVNIISIHICFDVEGKAPLDRAEWQ